MRYFLELSYNGAQFHGWQKQPNAVSVQEVIEQALSKVLRKNIEIIGAGRTDTGVHARQMYAHFDTSEEIVKIPELIISLNSIVGKNIFLKKILEVGEDAHARFDASEREYKYFITYHKNPFLKDFCWHSPRLLDLDSMNECAEYLTQISDFTSFAKLHSDAKTNICDVREATWSLIEKDQEAKDFIGNLNQGIVFTIRADRFLRNMVRAIVGTLVDVGRHKISLSDFKKIVETKDRCNAGTSMPANALFLWNIKYPDKTFRTPSLLKK